MRNAFFLAAIAMLPLAGQAQRFEDDPNLLDVTPFGRFFTTVAPASGGTIIQIYSLASGDPRFSLRTTDDVVVTALAATRTNEFVILGLSDGTIKFEDIGPTGTRETMRSLPVAITAVDQLHDSQLILSGSEVGEVNLWDPFTGGLIRSFDGSDSEIVDLGAVDRERFTTLDRDGEVRLYRIFDANPLHRFWHDQLRGRGVFLSAMSYHRNIAVLSDSNMLSLIDGRTGSVTAQRQLPESLAPTALQITADGEMVVIASQDRRIHFFRSDGLVPDGEVKLREGIPLALASSFGEDLVYVLTDQNTVVELGITDRIVFQEIPLIPGF